MRAATLGVVALSIVLGGHHLSGWLHALRPFHIPFTLAKYGAAVRVWWRWRGSRCIAVGRPEELMGRTGPALVVDTVKARVAHELDPIRGYDSTRSAPWRTIAHGRHPMVRKLPKQSGCLRGLNARICLNLGEPR